MPATTGLLSVPMPVISMSTVSPPSTVVSAVGVRVNVPEALPAPPGTVIVKFPTDAKSRPSFAVPPFTFTVTDFDDEPCVTPVNVAVTVTVRAPPSSATDDGLAPKTTFGSQVTVTSLWALVTFRESAPPPLKVWVARKRYVLTAGESEPSLCVWSRFATKSKASPNAVSTPDDDRLNHWPFNTLVKVEDFAWTFADAVSFAEALRPYAAASLDTRLLRSRPSAAPAPAPRDDPRSTLTVRGDDETR